MDDHLPQGPPHPKVSAGFLLQGMGKLRNIGAAVATLPSRVGVVRDAQGHSRAAEPWRAWYSLARWRRLRWDVLTRDLFTCQRPSCRRLVGDTAQLVADHIRPHRGDPDLFWSDTNLQTLCKPCHDSAKQAEERGGAGGQG